MPIPSFIGPIISGIISYFIGKGNISTKITGAVSGLGMISAVISAFIWLLGPGREWTITLNALELSGIVFTGAILIDLARKSPPPTE